MKAKILITAAILITSLSAQTQTYAQTSDLPPVFVTSPELGCCCQ